MDDMIEFIKPDFSFAEVFVSRISISTYTRNKKGSIFRLSSRASNNTSPMPLLYIKIIFRAIE